MTKKLIISCEDTTSQSPYAYEKRTTDCPYDKLYFSSALTSSDNEPFINEYGEYISLSE
jgi:hypothetical protein